MSNWLYFFQRFLQGVTDAGNWLISKPFADSGVPALVNLTPLELVTLTGLIIYIGVAVVKWVIS